MNAELLKQLEDLGVMEPGGLNEEEKALLNKLTDEEVETLIRIHKKLGPVAKDRHAARPMFPI